MKLRQWWDRETTPKRRPMTPEQYMRLSPRLAALVLLVFGQAVWCRSWWQAVATALLVAVWLILVPLVIPNRLERWRESRRRCDEPGGDGAGAGVSLRPLPPSHGSGASRPYPESGPPAA